MSKNEKLLQQILSGTSDTNVVFDRLCNLLARLGFRERINGSHHIFTKDGIVEIINLQPIGSLAKPYQVKNVREIVLRYRLGDSNGH